MKQFRIVPTKTFTKDFKKLPSEMKKRVLAALEKIQQDPYRGRKVKAVETGEWRWRVGDYRIRYDVEDQDIVLLRVRHRREIYRSL